MAKYDPLFKFLCQASNEPVELDFDEIERLVGPLPAAARKYSVWWSNESGGHVQANVWMNAGREVVSVDRERGRVEFSAATSRRGA